MVIEFFGLPGSGKTYCAERFARESGLPLIEVHGRPQTYFWAFVFACVRPRMFFFLLKEIAKENRRDTRLLRHKIHNLYLRAVAKEGKTFLRRDAVIDEGLFQVLLYLFERRIEKMGLGSFSFLFQDRTAHIVTARADIRRGRMQSRGRTPRAFLSTEYRECHWFPILEHNSNVIAAWIKEHFPYKEIHNE